MGDVGFAAPATAALRLSSSKKLNTKFNLIGLHLYSFKFKSPDCCVHAIAEERFNVSKILPVPAVSTAEISARGSTTLLSLPS